MPPASAPEHELDETALLFSSVACHWRSPRSLDPEAPDWQRWELSDFEPENLRNHSRQKLADLCVYVVARTAPLAVKTERTAEEEAMLLCGKRLLADLEEARVKWATGASLGKERFAPARLRSYEPEELERLAANRLMLLDAIRAVANDVPKKERWEFAIRWKSTRETLESIETRRLQLLDERRAASEGKKGRDLRRLHIEGQADGLSAMPR